MVYFVVVLIVVCLIVLTVLYIDYRRVTHPPLPSSQEKFSPIPAVKAPPRGLPSPETPHRFEGFIYKRVKKVGNFFAYAWVKTDKRGAV